ncbi:MAG: hypothetical protein M3N54_11270 [Acidobacteriota bacterium]|nr:hypothetical protein [Acidobacteriota bacterium]
MTLTGVIAQCVMCYRTAAAQQAERSRVLDSGILLLLVAPLLVVAVIMIRVRSASRRPHSKS